MFVEENQISFEENMRLDMLVVLGLDTFLLGFYD
jgi:hypothetical protein